MAQNEEINVSAIIQQLPPNLQRRFLSLGSFVGGIIDEEITRSKKSNRLSQENIHLIQLAALIYSLDSFFRSGTAAARQASVTFEEFGSIGFQIGSTVFTKDNDNTRRGELLADELRKAIIGTQMSRAIQTSSTMQQLIITLIREINDGQ